MSDDFVYSNSDLLLKNLIEAYCPIIYLITDDEERILETLNELSGELGTGSRFLITWYEGRCFGEYGVNEGDENFYPYFNTLKNTSKHIKDSLSVIQCVEGGVEGSGSIFAFFDVLEYFDDPKIVRAIKDVYYSFRFSYRTLVIISSENRLPVSLDGYVYTVVDEASGRCMDKIKLLKYIVDDLLVESMGGGQRGNDKLRKIITDNGDAFKNKIELLARSFIGLSKGDVTFLLDKALVKYKHILKIDINSVLKDKSKLFRRFGCLEYMCSDIKLDDLVGCEEIKKWCEESMGLMCGSTVSKYGYNFCKGICVSGISGNGKSQVIMAMSNYFHLPVVKIRLEDVRDDYNSVMGLIGKTAPVMLLLEGSDDKILKFMNDLDKCEVNNMYHVTLVLERESKMSDGDMFKMGIKKQFDVDVYNNDEVEKIIKKYLNGKSSDNDEVFGMIKDSGLLDKIINRVGIRYIKKMVDDIYSDYLMGSGSVSMIAEKAIDIDEDDGEFDINSRIKKGMVGKGGKVKYQLDPAYVNDRLRTIESYSKILNPHIKVVDKNLVIDGEIPVSEVEDVRTEFTPSQLSALRNKFISSDVKK